MQPFLKQIAQLFWQQVGPDISRLAFVFPNRRTGVFFQKYLSEVADHPIFSPAILTINDLFVKLSGLKQADHISLLFRLYQIYREQSHTDESFDQFYYWGEMLLNDFNDVDKYMVDARSLFSNVADLKEIDQQFEGVDPEVIEAIRSFWSSVLLSKNRDTLTAFLSMWQLLNGLYDRMHETLLSEGKGYEGMIFREVVDRMTDGAPCDLPWSKVVFVGLNALSRSEELLLDQLRDKGLADFYWDYGSPCIRDAANRASFFALRNLKRYPSAYPLQQEEPIDQKIEVYGVSGSVGQAKQVYELLDCFCTEENMDDEKAFRTAVVLPEERMLMPVLNSIPLSIRHINVTMGYPLSDTPIAVLIDLVIHLHRNCRFEDGICKFYFRDVVAILNHRYVVGMKDEEIAALLRKITNENIVYVPSDAFAGRPFLSALFSPVASVTDFPDYLMRLIESLNDSLSQKDSDDTSPDAGASTEKEYLFKYFAVVSRMKEVMKLFHIEMQLETYCRLLKKLIDSVTIPFIGEPLNGLQVMGVLETRALDFDRVILLSMNEGIFPLKKAAGSFIPYNLRKAYKLPTYEHQDSVWAYHFYRLIYRAKEVYLFYDTRSEGLLTGEVSRYVPQMEYLYRMNVQRKSVVFRIKSSRAPAIEVEKSAAVMTQLGRFLSDGKRALSASSINQYIRCPLAFFFSNVKDIQEEDEVKETIESDTFGDLLHKAMQIVYGRYCGSEVTKEIIDALRKNERLLSEAVSNAFQSIFNDSSIRLEGYNKLIAVVIRTYIEKILGQDLQFVPFLYLGAEKKVNQTLCLHDGKSVRLKAFIDRIDKVQEQVRIIDYKTGSVNKEAKSVESLFDSMEKKRAHQVFQVFFYSWLYKRMPEGNGQQIQPSIYHVLKASDDEKFSPFVTIDKTPVADFTAYEECFEQHLIQCLEELFDPSVPFRQTANVDNCAYCRFLGICGNRNA